MLADLAQSWLDWLSIGTNSNFSDQFSNHFNLRVNLVKFEHKSDIPAPNTLKSDLKKKHGFIPFGSNLTNIGAKPTIPAQGQRPLVQPATADK